MELQQIGASIPSLAGRFAAKEAVAKALGTGIGAISWQEIEILRGPEGEPNLTLNGRALEISRELGLETWSISITHNRTTAAAVVVAIGGTG
jgi:holo-[acyl-carrier protein] synthase